jgi:cytochrome c
MNKYTRFAIASAAGLAILSTASYMSVHAQAGKSISAGVYTAEQAKRGEKVYAEQCGFCHGDNLEGSSVIPPLSGANFYGAWKGKTAAELFEKVHQTMPATAPGTLTPAQAADVVAHMLSVAKFPAGSAELTAKVDELKQIQIEAPK